MVLALVPATWERDFCATQHESRKMSKMPRYYWVPAIVHCQINAADSIHGPRFVTHGPRKMAHALGLTKTRATGRKLWRVWLPTPDRLKRHTVHGPRFPVRLGRGHGRRVGPCFTVKKMVAAREIFAPAAGKKKARIKRAGVSETGG